MANKAVYDSICFRVGRQHMDLVATYGITRVMEEIEYESWYKDGLEEIGSSDISCWVDNIRDRLERNVAAKQVVA